MIEKPKLVRKVSCEVCCHGALKPRKRLHEQQDREEFIRHD